MNTRLPLTAKEIASLMFIGATITGFIICWTLAVSYLDTNYALAWAWSWYAVIDIAGGSAATLLAYTCPLWNLQNKE